MGAYPAGTEGFFRELERYEAVARRLEGWELDFEPEPLVEGPPWDYEGLAKELCGRADRVLDLGTGGGEVFSRLLVQENCRAVATEEWRVNAPVARRRLGGRAPVVCASSLALPFAGASFDLVLSRHEEICPAEVARVLARGGRFLTQQMVPDLWCELRAVFADMAIFPDHFREYQRGLAAAGLAVEEAREFRRPVLFRELGHLVYHLVAAPWTIPSFSVRSRWQELVELDRQCRSGEGLVLTEGFYLLRARASGS